MYAENPTAARINEAAEVTARIAHDIARTLDAAASQIARAANPHDVTTHADLFHQIARIQRIIEQTNEDLAPSRLARHAADALG